jgi:hypothetical protein
VKDNLHTRESKKGKGLCIMEMGLLRVQRDLLPGKVCNKQ